MTPDLMNRLVCAKVLFLNGVDVIDRSTPFGEALALLSFQDAVEMTLGAVADHRHIAKPAKEFLDQIKNVQESLGKDLPYWTGMNQLNKARVALKHHGILPSQDTLAKARGDTEGFILNLVREAFGMDFRTLSMASLVDHNRTANWLRKAESYATTGDDAECLNACAIALALFRRAYLPSHSQRQYETILRTSQSRRGEPYIQDGIFRLVETLEKDIDELRERLEWVSSGISISDYERFRRMTPEVLVAINGKLHLSSRFREIPIGGEACAFGISFVTQTILRLQAILEPRQRYEARAVRKIWVTHPTEVVFDDNESPVEVLRSVKAGQWLVGRSETDDTPEWIALVEGEDWAKVRRDCVEIVSGAL